MNVHRTGNRRVPPEQAILCVVETWNVAKDEKEQEFRIDHRSREDREKLEKHMYWAFRNGRGIVIRPIWEE